MMDIDEVIDQALRNIKVKETRDKLRLRDEAKRQKKLEKLADKDQHNCSYDYRQYDKDKEFIKKIK